MTSIKTGRWAKTTLTPDLTMFSDILPRMSIYGSDLFIPIFIAFLTLFCITRSPGHFPVLFVFVFEGTYRAFFVGVMPEIYHTIIIMAAAITMVIATMSLDTISTMIRPVGKLNPFKWGKSYEFEQTAESIHKGYAAKTMTEFNQLYGRSPTDKKELTEFAKLLRLRKLGLESISSKVPNYEELSKRTK